MKSRICVLGEGAWGTAISLVLADNGHDVILWCYNKEAAQEILCNRINSRYLPGVRLPNSIMPVTDLKTAFDAVEYVFEAIPVEFLRTLLQQAVSFVSREYIWVILSKGIEQRTLSFPSEIIDQVIGYQTAQAAALGPTYAIDLAQKQLTGITVAGTTQKIAQSVADLLANQYVKPFLSLDIYGAQVGAAFKNMLALLVGGLQGIGCTDNLKAFVLTRGLAEMRILAKIFGGNPETIYGLSGVGDVILTALGKHSKNQKVGYLRAQGYTLDEIYKKTGFIPEGVNTALACEQLLYKHAKQLMIFSQIPAFIKGSITLNDFLKKLIEQPIMFENLY